MAREAMSSADFEYLLCCINRETSLNTKRLEILHKSEGNFDNVQAARLLHAYPAAPDKVRVLQMLESRMVRMTCESGRDILNAVSIHNDKVIALDILKRYLCDAHTPHGQEYILSAFPYDSDKLRALYILHTVRADVANKVPAGGHQLYMPVGGLLTQQPPNNPHNFGPISEQMRRRQGEDQIKLPSQFKPGIVPSMYTGHPSYAYPRGTAYAEANRLPGTAGFPAAQQETEPHLYPDGAPPLGTWGGFPAPTGFPRESEQVESAKPTHNTGEKIYA